MYTPVAALQGGIGASTVEGRDRKIKLEFGRYMFKTRNGILKAICRRMCGESKPGRWMRQLVEYMGELEISLDGLEYDEIGIRSVGEIGGEILRVGQHCGEMVQ